MPITSFLAGASGLIGSHLLPLLLSSGNPTVALVRRPLNQTDPSLEERPFDAPAFVDGANVFVTLGTTIKKAGSEAAFRKVDFDLPLALARESVKAGARQFLIVTSVDSDPKARNFYLRVKGELEQEIDALSFQSVHVFRPSFLVGDRAESRPGETIGVGFARALSPILLAGLRKYKPIRASIVAAAMARAAQEAKPGRHIYHYDDMVR